MAMAWAGFRGRNGRMPRRQRHGLVVLECLEDRRLLSAGAQPQTPAAAVWSVRGTGSDDGDYLKTAIFMG
jgi:hypothetical protein